MSRRAGQLNKLLYPVAGRPVVAHVIEQLKYSRVHQIVAVTGHEHELVSACCEEFGIEHCHNPNYLSGIASSVAAGLCRLEEADAIVVCLGDMPHVTTSVINQLITTFEQQPDLPAVIPTYRGTRGNPVLLAKCCFTELKSLEGDQGASILFKHYGDRILQLEVECAGILKDYDTQDQLRAFPGI